MQNHLKKKQMNQLLANKDFIDGIEILYNHKPKKKQYLKFLEELAELSAAILKHINKGEPEENILEEMVDVEVNMQLMLKHFTKVEVEEMCDKKVVKMWQNKNFKKYQQ